LRKEVKILIQGKWYLFVNSITSKIMPFERTAYAPFRLRPRFIGPVL